MHSWTISLQALVATSIFFVWVVRYGNVVEEFKHYGLPDWLRDLVGILKFCRQPGEPLAGRNALRRRPPM